MDKATALEVTRYLTELLREEGLNIEQTILFGSCAIDEAHEDSDVDIAIISEDFADKNYFERSALTNPSLRLTIRRFLVPIDVLNFTPDEYANGTSLGLQFVRDKGVVV